MGTSADGKMNNKRGADKPKKGNSRGHMLDRTRFSPENIPLSSVISLLTKEQRERLVSGYDLKNFARIFEDGDIMATADSFLTHGMNVSETSRVLYMHRNTLIYRLNKIQNETGLDIRIFEMAVTFEILRILYELK